MTVNQPLVGQLMDQLIAFPETHDQREFFNHCGTPSCAAGWAIHFSGLTYTEATYDEAAKYSDSDTTARELENRTACPEMIIGQGLLGITSDDAERLFWDYNSNAMVVAMLKDLSNGENLRSTTEYAEETDWTPDQSGFVYGERDFPRPNIDQPNPAKDLT